jgi:hypothetical protein
MKHIPSMIESVIVLALLTLLVATDSGPDAGDSIVVRRDPSPRLPSTSVHHPFP